MASTATFPSSGDQGAGSLSRPALLIAAAVGLAFVLIAGQLMRLAWLGQQGPQLNIAEPIVQSFARPDIVDRNGRLLATDLQFHSLFADPLLVIDPDEAAERIVARFTDIDGGELRRQLADKSRRFVWIKRGLPPALAQEIHDWGLPGLAFRTEPKRAYPQGRVAGHILGTVSLDNKGLSGLERHIDDELGLQSGLAGDIDRPPVTLTLDLGAQHGVEEELAAAMVRYSARAAAGIIMEVRTGEVLAGVSLPDIDPARAIEALEPDRIDRLQVATYELGSVLKVLTVAMALDGGMARLDTAFDVRAPLRVGPWTIRDPHPAGRPLSVREIFIQSSNVGAALLGLAAGAERQRAFLQRIGLIGELRTEAGRLTPPSLPETWGEAEVATISYGHGIAVAPLQLAAAAATTVNGGFKVQPTFVRVVGEVAPAAGARERVLAAETSATMLRLMRENVTQPGGTGRRADVPGYEVGGKTGTAEMAGPGGYKAKSVVASFVAVFPISAPRYLVLVTLIEPKSAVGTKGQITAGVNAAPVAGRIIARTAGLLGVVPR